MATTAHGIKDIAEGRTDLYWIDPRKLHVKPGWNNRDLESPENVKHVEETSLSIAEVGVKEPLTVYWEDGKAYISDGHVRHAATLRAIKVHKAQIKKVPVKTEDRYSSEADRVFSQIVRNSGKPFTPFEQSKVFKKLVDLGWEVKEIATKSGRSDAWVKELLTLSAAPEDVKSLVRKGSVSASLAASTVKKKGAEAGRTLAAAVDRAKSEGKDRATAKHTREAKPSTADRINEAFRAGWNAVLNSPDGETCAQALAKFLNPKLAEPAAEK